MKKLLVIPFLFSLVAAIGQTPQFTRDAANGSKYIYVPEQDNDNDFRSVAQFRIGPYLTLGNYGNGNRSWIGNNALLNYSAYHGTGSSGDGNKFVPNYAVGKALVINLDYATADFTGYTYAWNNNTAAVDLNDFTTSWILGLSRSYFRENVGIGVFNPAEKLDVNGAVRINNGSNSWRFVTNADGSFSVKETGFSGAINIYKNGNSNINLLNLNNGNVGIGTTSPDAKLTVKGHIHTQEVNVDLAGAVAPDYVFAKDYKLLTLKEVEDYIKTFSHLPEVPSATEMEENGINLKEMNLLLLKKVEELTLYTIGQKELISQLIERIEKLEKK